MNTLNFEKFILGFLLIGVVVIAALKYMLNDVVNSDWVYIIGIIISAFTARKVFSYFKPERYNQNIKNDEQNGNV